MTRDLTEHDVEFTIECQPEDTPLDGNASAVNPDVDAETEAWIRAELDHGNEWAWCCIKVTASWGDFEGADYLGCCSYTSEDDFRAPGGYFDDMKAVALGELNDLLRRAAQHVPIGGPGWHPTATATGPIVSDGVSARFAAIEIDYTAPPSVADRIDAAQAKRDQGEWIPACGGTEVPFRTRTGARLLYCWQPSTGRHAYLDLGTDMILTDDESRAAMGDV